jgi:hypothetical protein
MEAYMQASVSCVRPCEPELRAHVKQTHEMENSELELAMALRLLAKAIFKLQHIGAQRQADEMLAEAKRFGFDITIMPDPTDERN